MQVLELRNTLGSLDATDYASCLVRSLRTDEKVWTFLTQSSGEISKQIADLAASQKLNPGTLGLLAFNQELVKTNYPDSRMQVSLLEECMVHYESYLQQHSPPATIEDAAKLAVVLIEKRKIAPAWRHALLEVVNRMHISDGKALRTLWGTALIVTVNLVKDQDELLFDLLKLQSAEQGIDSLIFSLISLPVSEYEKAEKLVKALQDQSAMIIEKTISFLISINEKELAQTSAQLLVGKYKIEDASEKGTRDILENPAESLQQAMLYKQIASVAQIAGEIELAGTLLEKSCDILDAISTGIKVQNLSLLDQAGNESGYEELIRKFQLDQATNAVISQELASVGVVAQNGMEGEIESQPITAISQAKKINSAGNPELAKSECEKAFISIDNRIYDSATEFIPQFNPNWNPGEMVNTLNELGAKKEAVKMAASLYAKNPASLSATKASAETCFDAADYAAALPLFEYASLAGENSTPMLRKLAECYARTGNSEACYKVRQQLVEVEVPAKDDMLQFAEAAISAGRSHEVFPITSKILEQDPMNASALTINGKAQAMTGNRDQALDYFTKAIEAGSDNADPWIGLSEVQVKGGEFREAIETLRQGLAALPADREIKRRLAEQLMDSGSASEALPLLNDLAEEDQDALIGVLQLDALKILGMPEYDAMVISLYSKFPENEEIAQAFAAQLIKNGKHSEAKNVLQSKLSQVQSNTPTALTYAEAVVGMDVHYSGEPKSISTQEMEKVESIVERYLDQDSDHTHAQLVKAELLVSKKNYAEAFKYYSRLLEKQTSVDKSLWERIQAGFAQTAAFMGKFEVALAAIKQAVDSQPDWVGLRKIMANIYGLAGEVADALVQAERVLEVAPQIVESALWFADFASGLGKSDTAENKLAAIIETKSNALLLRLKLAEMKVNNGKSVEALELMEELKAYLSMESSELELISAATLYDKVHDIEAALNCLEYRYQSYASLSSGLDLAGYEYIQGHFAKAEQYLDRLNETSDLVPCLKAEVLVKTGDLEKAISLVQNNNTIKHDEELNLVFIPEAWKKLMNSSFANRTLEAKILFTQGKAATCLETTALWLEDEPDNAEARILAIESTLALGELPGEDLYLPILVNDVDDESNDHLTALIIIALLENNQAIEAQQVFEKIGKVESSALKLANVQLKLMVGRLAEAESIFDEVLSTKDEINFKELHFQLGLKRLLVKAGAGLKRWNEALSISTEVTSVNNWNMECVMQSLSTLTRAKEFEKIANSLSIDTHNPAAFLGKINFEEELDGLVGLTGGKNEKAVERWLLRGKMCSSPNSENIRAFALVTPTPDDAAAMVAALHNNGQESTALQVARKFPTDSQVLFELACVQADGDQAAALETLNTLIANDPLIPAAVAFRGLIYENLGKLDMAINDLEQAINDWPNEILWRMKAASLWQNYGNNKNAIVQLEAAYARAPEHAETALELGKAYAVDGESEKAVEILSPLAKQNPNFYEAWEALAEAQSNCNQWENALESAKKASLVNPFSIKPYLMSGKIHLLNGNLDRALDQARTAVTQNKRDADAILFLAKVLHARGEKQQALAALEMTNQCENVTVQTMVDHVNLVKEINGGAYAKELISSFSEKYPENVDLMKMLASAQEENGDTADAEKTVKRALQVEPDEPELHLFLGKISAETGQLDQAIHHLSQGIAHKAASTDGYLMLSKVYEQQREFTKALDALKQAMDAAPNDTRSYLAAANLYRNSKNYNAAEKVLQKAVEIDPQDVTIRRQLGALLALKLVHHSQEASSQS
ncbi:MAG: hypothetical protein CVU42_13125 [Chloroflexi bacterium HGW-Chloroflexi-4]|jgi:tetratricopeptide (TPR) repeat protein|nr:MAG: hypothetical protein CVU42_13125 [Chloroflexi bacterium HGW-Chloroflexi-4]